MNDRALFALGGAALFALSLAFTALQPQIWKQARAESASAQASVPAAAAPAEAATLPQPWLEVRVAGGRVVLDGTVPDSATHAALLGRAIARHGAAAIDDRVIVRPTAKADWFAQGVAGFPPDLTGAREATVRLTASGLSWQGDRPTAVADAARPDAAGTGTAAVPATVTTTAAAAPETAPATSTASPTATAVASPTTPDTAAADVVEAVFFTTNSIDLTPKAQVMLGAALARLRVDPERRIEVVGHADARGDPTWNRTLSELRARTVADWLRAHGVPGDRIAVVGAGIDASVPIVPEAMRQARRVELRLA